jgi:hypothetical protein
MLVPNSVCMARSGEDDRHVRRLVDHISPRLCRRECWVRVGVVCNTKQHLVTKPSRMRYLQVAHAREMLV